MKKILLLCVLLMTSVVMIYGQKTLKVTARDMNMVIDRCADENETVVEIQSNVALTFESTMDKDITFCDTKKENGFFFYRLKFTVEKKYNGRKLKIKSYGFETHIEPLDLVAKVPIGYMVIDIDSDVGVGCYYEHLNKGNKFFENTQYANAKEEYLLALACSDIPDDNELSNKIDDSGTCLDAKRTADDFYNAGKFDYALREYEKVYAINQKDAYIQNRIVICSEKIANQPRTIRGTVIAATDKRALPGVIIQIAYPETDRKGKTIIKWRNVGGVTDWNGRYEVTIPRKVQQLRFVSNDQRKNGAAILPVTSENMDIVLTVVDLIELQKTTQVLTDKIIRTLKK